MKTREILAAAVLGLVACTATAATREELKREREAIEAEHARRAEACKTQFVVTPCLDKVRADKQKALSHVTAQENALDAGERQARADARKKRLADKAVSAEAAASAAPAVRASDASAKTPRRPAKAREKSGPSQEERSAREQEKRDAFEARQREIEAHRADVERRNAERARTKPAPRPLPPPASAGT
jgi:colicin import membrane protein